MTKPLTMSEQLEDAYRQQVNSYEESAPAFDSIRAFIRELDAAREALKREKDVTKHYAQQFTDLQAQYERVTKDRDRLAGDREQLVGIILGISVDAKILMGRINSAFPPPEPQGAAEVKALKCSLCGGYNDEKSPQCICTDTNGQKWFDPDEAPAPQPGEFGEPWRQNECLVIDAIGEAIFGPLEVESSWRQLERAIICVNALSGIPDPEAFVRATKSAIPRQFVTDTKVISGREWAAIEALYKAVEAHILALSVGLLWNSAADQYGKLLASFKDLAAIRGEGK